MACCLVSIIHSLRLHPTISTGQFPLHTPTAAYFRQSSILNAPQYHCLAIHTSCKNHSHWSVLLQVFNNGNRSLHRKQPSNRSNSQSSTKEIPMTEIKGALNNTALDLRQLEIIGKTTRYYTQRTCIDTVCKAHCETQAAAGCLTSTNTFSHHLQTLGVFRHSNNLQLLHTAPINSYANTPCSAQHLILHFAKDTFRACWGYLFHSAIVGGFVFTLLQHLLVDFLHLSTSI